MAINIIEHPSALDKLLSTLNINSYANHTDRTYLLTANDVLDRMLKLESLTYKNSIIVVETVK